MNINAVRLASVGVITSFAVMLVVTPGSHVFMNAHALLLLSSTRLITQRRIQDAGLSKINAMEERLV